MPRLLLQEDDALLLLQEGEQLVSVMPQEQGKFFCKKAKVLHLSKQPQQAQKALVEAKLIAEKLNDNRDSELGKRIVEAEEFISAAPTEQ